jgi:hypothetical protein
MFVMKRDGAKVPFEKNKISPQYKQQLYLYTDVFIYLTKLIVN